MKGDTTNLGTYKQLFEGINEEKAAGQHEKMPAVGLTHEWLRSFSSWLKGSMVIQNSFQKFGLSAVVALILVLAFSPLIKGRTIHFSGYEWEVKKFTQYKRGPGPNYFSDSPRNVWVDDQGRLHLRIEKRGEKWYCAEVYLLKNLGYGYYTFQMEVFAEKLDPNAVLGLFVYAGKNEEIDIEISGWGKSGGTNVVFALQPAFHLGHTDSFRMELGESPLTFEFLWTPNRVEYWAMSNSPDPESEEAEIKLRNHWSYSEKGIPSEENLNARINLWLFKGKPPREKEEIEVIIEKFEFAPL